MVSGRHPQPDGGFVNGQRELLGRRRSRDAEASGGVGGVPVVAAEIHEMALNRYRGSMRSGNSDESLSGQR